MSSSSSSSSSEEYSESSSSLQYSSSSSSSLWDYSGSKIIPFYIEHEQNNPIWRFVFSEQDVFAGSGSDGVVLKSSDRYTWSQYFKTDDIHVTGLAINDGYLFVGTSPNGKVYKIDMDSLESVAYDDFIGGIIDIKVYDDTVYLAANGPSRIYSYNPTTNIWSLFYEPYQKITSMEVINDYLYVTMESKVVIYYDGTKWLSLSTNDNVDNTASIRNLNTDVFSNVNYSFINRAKITSTDNMNTEDIYDVFPFNWNDGVSSIAKNGDGVILGGLNTARVYNYYNGKYSLLFDTNTDSVRDVVNVEKDVNLVAIDNKIYLVHCGSINSQEVPSAIVQNENLVAEDTSKSIVITYPSGNESIEIGQSISIQWGSTKSINDAIKLDLYKGGSFLQSINSNTSNDGLYEWDVPLALRSGDDYQIYIEWLSAGNATTENKNISKTFSIVYEAAQTITTTTKIVPEGEPLTEGCRGIPILELPQDEYIVKMENDPYYGGILIATSKGQILHCDTAKLNAFFTGERTIFADVQDGYGFSNASTTSLTYALYNKISEINEDKEIVSWKFERDASAIKTEKIIAVLLGPAIYVKEDLGLWKELVWSESKPEETGIVISIRSAVSIELLSKASWRNSFRSLENESGIITKDLTQYNIRDKYVQIKVEMTTSKASVTPSVANISLTYSTKQSTYFYTTKFSLENDANAKNGILVANITQPSNTEIRFGINNTNSNDWNDYQIINPNKLFELNSWENVKVGIKLISYDTSVPEVSEFSIMSGSEILKALNQ